MKKLLTSSEVELMETFSDERVAVAGNRLLTSSEVELMETGWLQILQPQRRRQLLTSSEVELMETLSNW